MYLVARKWTYLNWGPSNAFLCILVLFRLECELNKKLLQLFIAIVDAQLLEAMREKGCEREGRERKRGGERGVGKRCEQEVSNLNHIV